MKFNKNDFEEYIIWAVETQHKISDKDLKRLVFKYGKDLDCLASTRWFTEVESLITIRNRTFIIVWGRSSENPKEDIFPEQPYEVRINTYEKVETITEYEMVKHEA